METVFMIAGFVLAAYSVVANDVIQTLGTFLSSNRHRKWWILWGYTGTILALVLIYGWYSYDGDVSYGRLQKVGDLPDPFHWWYVLPPLVLVIITRFGVPVSTTFLILSVFSTKLIGDMVMKSLMGYALAFTVAILLYVSIARVVEKRFIDSRIEGEDMRWTVAQWISTGFLWSMWLIQDLANIFVFLDRQMPFAELLLALLLILGLLGYIFYNRGGAIQKIVTSKTNTTDIRSATIIDFIFGLILLFFKELSNVPMSTTWVFVGLLAGRELAITYRLKERSKDLNIVVRLIAKDLGKVILGLVVSVALVLLISQLKG